MIRLVRASFAAIGAFVETLFPAPPVRAQSSGGGDVPAVPPTVSESTPAGTTIVERLAAAGFGSDVVEPPLWPFDAEFGPTAPCVHCGTTIRVDVDDNPYHVATGFYPCADKKHYASAD